MNIVQQHRGTLIFEGIAFMILGILAVALPGIMTLGVELFIGWLFEIYWSYQFTERTSGVSESSNRFTATSQPP